MSEIEELKQELKEAKQELKKANERNRGLIQSGARKARLELQAEIRGLLGIGE